MKYFVLSGAILLLSTSVCALVFLGRKAEIRIPPASVFDGLAQPVPGYVVKELPIAEGEEMKQAVAEQLNYDHGVLYEYRTGDRAFTLYVAYWSPGRFHPRLISGHTPDICWTHAGWRLAAAESSYDFRFECASGPLEQGQYRYFTNSGSAAHVVYWHLLGGRLSGYSSGPGSKDRRFLQTFLTDAFSLAPFEEQYFVRISSSLPFSEWRNDPMFNRVLEKLFPLLSDV